MMKRAITAVLGLIVALAISPLSGPNIGSARAEPRCKSFQSIAHASLPGATDEWGGPLYGSLDGEVLLGILSGNDGDVTFRGAIGQGRGGVYTIGFGCDPGDPGVCTDTLTFEVPTSVFPIPPGMIGLGHYNGNTARITGGTGRFESASGNLNVTGTFFVWPDPNWRSAYSADSTPSCLAISAAFSKVQVSRGCTCALGAAPRFLLIYHSCIPACELRPFPDSKAEELLRRWNAVGGRRNSKPNSRQRGYCKGRSDEETHTKA